MPKQHFLDRIKGTIKRKEPLKRYTTFKIGGPAEYLIEPFDTADLRYLVMSAKKYKMPVLIIGAGSNLLVSDKGIDGLVIKLNSPVFKKISFNGNILACGAGCMINCIIKKSQEYCLSDLEFLAGIPGTVGGALSMNAGIPGKNIGDLVEDVTVMDYNGEIKTYEKNGINFNYRETSLSKYIILHARLKLTKNKDTEIKSTIKNYLDSRKNKQELFLPSAGCVFRNPPAGPAGKLIDSCGLKGARIGDACVSRKHANFIVNIGKASSGDVSMLMGLIKEHVENKFNVILKPEIKIWARRGKA